MTSPTHLWLIRHGQSEANAGLLMDDHTQTPLTDLGHAQAQHVSTVLLFTPDLIVSSPFLRAQQTSQPTRDRFPSIPTETWPIQELTYLAAHRYTQTTLAERMPFVHAYWERKDPATPDGPGAESFWDFTDRLQNFFAQARQHDAKQIVAFSHGNFIRGVLWYALCGSHEHARNHMTHFNYFYRSIPVPNTAILRLTFHEDGTLTLQPTDTSHLSTQLNTL